MTPDTVHFVAQMIRHNRAMATSFEKWVRKQPASPACREMLQVLAVYRGVMTNVEEQISKFQVETEEPEPPDMDIDQYLTPAMRRSQRIAEEILGK